MDQDSLVKEALTEDMIKAGAALTTRLDQIGWQVVASLWFYFPLQNGWRLILASPAAADLGPKQAYELVQKALSKVARPSSVLALSDLGIVDPTDPVIVALGSAIQTGPGIGGIRFTRNVVNGHFIDDAYIYRIHTQGPANQAT